MVPHPIAAVDIHFNVVIVLVRKFSVTRNFSMLSIFMSSIIMSRVLVVVLPVVLVPKTRLVFFC